MARGTKRRLAAAKKKVASVTRDDTQPVDESVICESQNPQTKPYARLVGIRRGVSNIDLLDEKFICGRGSDEVPVNYAFTTLCSDNGLYRFISKVQFDIVWDSDKRRAILTDHSRNGTLVNQELVGKENSRVLNSGDLISIGIPLFIVFVYQVVNDGQYPDELTRKYHVTSHCLGKGGFGNVVLGYKKSDRSVLQVAIKILTVQFSARCSRAIAKARDIRNEVEVMKKINHPNVVAIYDWVSVAKYSYMVIEYVGGGEFFSKVVDPKYNRMGLGESLGKYFTFQLIDAVMYLHSLNICHRDIKPENILCSDKSERCILKLTDFGMAKNSARMKTRCGTPSYNAPEIVANEGIEYTPKVDIWSLGCVLFITFSGYPPFSEEYADMPMDEQVMKGRLVFHTQWRRISRETQEMIKWMLTVDPANRPSAVNLMNSDWLKCPDSRMAKHDVAKTMKVIKQEPDTIEIKKKRLE